MIENWNKILETSLRNLQKEYLHDNRSLINEHDLKYKVRQYLEKVANNDDDLLVKPEVPWYDKGATSLRPKFYFDLTIFRNSIFELRLRDQALRRKGFYYNDMSIAIMLKFVKPSFNFCEIADDIQKLKVFADETADQVYQHKPILIIGITDNQLYKQTEDKIFSVLKTYNDSFLSRLTIYYFNQSNFIRLEFEK